MSKKFAILVFVVAATLLVLAGCSYVLPDAQTPSTSCDVVSGAVGNAQTQYATSASSRTVNYYVNGELNSVEVVPNDYYTVQVPTMDGYVFEGLFDAEQGGKQYVDSNGESLAPYAESDDFDLFAQFTVKRITVSFYSADGETLLGTTTADAGTPFVNLAPYALDDGTLVTAWSKTVNGDAFADSAVYDDCNFYVKDRCFVIQVDYGFGKKQTLKVPNGQTYSLQAPEQTGYTFLGWQDGDGNDVVCDSAVTPDCSTTVTARWSSNEYTVYLDACGGLCASSGTAVYGETLALPVPTRSGYIFAGWYVGGIQLTDSLGKGTVWQNNCAVLATARWLKASATFCDETSYVITDSGRNDQHKDKVELAKLLGAPISDYLKAGATKLEVHYSVEIAEIDDGYQYLFLSNDSRGKTFSSALLFTKCIQHGVLHKDCNSYAHEGVVTLPLCNVADQVYVLYGASGILNDDWIRNGVEITFTIR